MSRLKFIHLSDLHLTGRDEHPQGYDTWTNTNRALDHSLGLFPDADFIVITGDLANWGEREAYVRLKKRLEAVPIPVFLMVGNHDSRDNFLSVFGDRHPFALPYIQYVHDFKAYRLMFLDTQTIGTHGGAFNRERLGWMENQLARADRDVLIFMHHHPVEIGAPSMDAKGIGDMTEFHRILARYRDKIRHIFHGHCHTLLQGNIEGISFTGIRSMGEQAYTDLRTEKACRWVSEPHYAVALVTPNSVVTHVLEFNYSGPMIVRERQKFEEFVGMCADRGVTVPNADPVMHVAE